MMQEGQSPDGLFPRHRAGKLLGDGTTKMLASGSKSFCHQKAQEHMRKHGHDPEEYVVIEDAESLGLPHKWK